MEKEENEGMAGWRKEVEQGRRMSNDVRKRRRKRGRLNELGLQRARLLLAEVGRMTSMWDFFQGCGLFKHSEVATHENNQRGWKGGG